MKKESEGFQRLGAPRRLDPGMPMDAAALSWHHGMMNKFNLILIQFPFLTLPISQALAKEKPQLWKTDIYVVCERDGSSGGAMDREFVFMSNVSKESADAKFLWTHAKFTQESASSPKKEDVIHYGSATCESQFVDGKPTSSELNCWMRDWKGLDTLKFVRDADGTSHFERSTYDSPPTIFGKFKADECKMVSKKEHRSKAAVMRDLRKQVAQDQFEREAAASKGSTKQPAPAPAKPGVK